MHANKYVNVTGITPNYVRVLLKSGEVGFVPITAVRPDFAVMHNFPVYEKPNQRSRQVASVHSPGSVQVIGNTPGYLKVRMRSGVEGFVPTEAFR